MSQPPPPSSSDYSRPRQSSYDPATSPSANMNSGSSNGNNGASDDIGNNSLEEDEVKRHLKSRVERRRSHSVQIDRSAIAAAYADTSPQQYQDLRNPLAPPMFNPANRLATARENIMGLGMDSTSAVGQPPGGSASLLGGASTVSRLHAVVGARTVEEEREGADQFEKEMEVARAQWSDTSGNNYTSGLSPSSVMSGRQPVGEMKNPPAFTRGHSHSMSYSPASPASYSLPSPASSSSNSSQSIATISRVAAAPLLSPTSMRTHARSSSYAPTSYVPTNNYSPTTSATLPPPQNLPQPQLYPQTQPQQQSPVKSALSPTNTFQPGHNRSASHVPTSSSPSSAPSSNYHSSMISPTNVQFAHRPPPTPPLPLQPRAASALSRPQPSAPASYGTGFSGGVSAGPSHSRTRSMGGMSVPGMTSQTSAENVSRGRMSSMTEEGDSLEVAGITNFNDPSSRSSSISAISPLVANFPARYDYPRRGSATTSPSPRLAAPVAILPSNSPASPNARSSSPSPFPGTRPPLMSPSFPDYRSNSPRLPNSYSPAQLAARSMEPSRLSPQIPPLSPSSQRFTNQPTRFNPQQRSQSHALRGSPVVVNQSTRPGGLRQPPFLQQLQRYGTPPPPSPAGATPSSPNRALSNNQPVLISRPNQVNSAEQLQFASQSSAEVEGLPRGLDGQILRRWPVDSSVPRMNGTDRIPPVQVINPTPPRPAFGSRPPSLSYSTRPASRPSSPSPTLQRNFVPTPPILAASPILESAPPPAVQYVNLPAPVARLLSPPLAISSPPIDTSSYRLNPSPRFDSPNLDAAADDESPWISGEANGLGLSGSGTIDDDLPDRSSREYYQLLEDFDRARAEKRRLERFRNNRVSVPMVHEKMVELVLQEAAALVATDRVIASLPAFDITTLPLAMEEAITPDVADILQPSPLPDLVPTSLFAPTSPTSPTLPSTPAPASPIAVILSPISPQVALPSPIIEQAIEKPVLVVETSSEALALEPPIIQPATALFTKEIASTAEVETSAPAEAAVVEEKVVEKVEKVVAKVEQADKVGAIEVAVSPRIPVAPIRRALPVVEKLPPVYKPSTLRKITPILNKIAPPGVRVIASQPTAPTNIINRRPSMDMYGSYRKAAETFATDYSPGDYSANKTTPAVRSHGRTQSHIPTSMYSPASATSPAPTSAPPAVVSSIRPISPSLERIPASPVDDSNGFVSPPLQSRSSSSALGIGSVGTPFLNRNTSSASNSDRRPSIQDVLSPSISSNRALASSLVNPASLALGAPLSTEFIMLTPENAKSFNCEDAFYENETIAIAHRSTGTAGVNITSLFLWRGQSAAKSSEEGIRKRIEELTQHFKVEMIEMEQGREISALLQIMGGQLVVRQGSRPN